MSSSGEEEEEQIQLPPELDPSSVNALAAISENSYESDLDDVAQHVQLFHPDDIHLLPVKFLFNRTVFEFSEFYSDCMTTYGGFQFFI